MAKLSRGSTKPLLVVLALWFAAVACIGHVPTVSADELPVGYTKLTGKSLAASGALQTINGHYFRFFKGGNGTDSALGQLGKWGNSGLSTVYGPDGEPGLIDLGNGGHGDGGDHTVLIFWTWRLTWERRTDMMLDLIPSLIPVQTTTAIPDATYLGPLELASDTNLQKPAGTLALPQNTSGEIVRYDSWTKLANGRVVVNIAERGILGTTAKAAAWPVGTLTENFGTENYPDTEGKFKPFEVGKKRWAAVHSYSGHGFMPTVGTEGTVLRIGGAPWNRGGTNDSGQVWHFDMKLGYETLQNEKFPDRFLGISMGWDSSREVMWIHGRRSLWTYDPAKPDGQRFAVKFTNPAGLGESKAARGFWSHRDQAYYLWGANGAVGNRAGLRKYAVALDGTVTLEPCTLSGNFTPQALFPNLVAMETFDGLVEDTLRNVFLWPANDTMVQIEKPRFPGDTWRTSDVTGPVKLPKLWHQDALGGNNTVLNSTTRGTGTMGKLMYDETQDLVIWIDTPSDDPWVWKHPDQGPHLVMPNLEWQKVMRPLQPSPETAANEQKLKQGFGNKHTHSVSLNDGRVIMGNGDGTFNGSNVEGMGSIGYFKPKTREFGMFSNLVGGKPYVNGQKVYQNNRLDNVGIMYVDNKGRFPEFDKKVGVVPGFAAADQGSKTQGVLARLGDIVANGPLNFAPSETFFGPSDFVGTLVFEETYDGGGGTVPLATATWSSIQYYDPRLESATVAAGLRDELVIDHNNSEIYVTPVSKRVGGKLQTHMRVRVSAYKSGSITGGRGFMMHDAREGLDGQPGVGLHRYPLPHYELNFADGITGVWDAPRGWNALHAGDSAGNTGTGKYDPVTHMYWQMVNSNGINIREISFPGTPTRGPPGTYGPLYPLPTIKQAGNAAQSARGFLVIDVEGRRLYFLSVYDPDGNQTYKRARLCYFNLPGYKGGPELTGGFVPTPDLPNYAGMGQANNQLVTFDAVNKLVVVGYTRDFGAHVYNVATYDPVKESVGKQPWREISTVSAAYPGVSGTYARGNWLQGNDQVYDPYHNLHVIWGGNGSGSFIDGTPIPTSVEGKPTSIAMIRLGRGPIREFGGTAVPGKKPVVTITSPTSADTFTTGIQPTSLAGTASHPDGIMEVSWANNRGGSGIAVGTDTWSIPVGTLQAGVNIITVTAKSSIGTTSTDTLTVTYNAPPPPVGTNSATGVIVQVPTSVPAGATFQATVRFTNTGTTTWSTANNYGVGSQSPQDNNTWGAGSGRTQLPKSVAPGESVDVSALFTAPATAGTRPFAWKMVKDTQPLRGWFGQTVSQNITVTSP